MAQILPFKGVHYNTNLLIADVTAPPYDVISPNQQAELYARHPQNVVRLILNATEPNDGATSSRYTRAAAFLQTSLENGTLQQDEQPALYEYIQQFEDPLNFGKTIQRRALFVALGLAPYEQGVVLPHEETHPKAKADRLEIMRATQANPEPIYALYEDPTLTVAKSLEAARAGQEPLLRATFPGFTLPDSEQHLLFRHTDTCLLAELEEFFASRRIWIADGHHRYETALNYQCERREEDGNPSELQPYDSMLVGLSAFEDPGLVVLPTHRLVKNVSQSRLEEAPLLLERYFHVQFLSVEAGRIWIKQEVAGEKRFLILLSTKAYALILRDQSVLDGLVEDHCEAWRRLDVSLLQVLVLDRTFGISWQSLAHTPDVAYTRDEDEAVSKVQSGEFQLACLLQNPTVTEVRDVAASGDKMPQKSTFFYPKLWSGLVLRLLSE